MNKYHEALEWLSKKSIDNGYGEGIPVVGTLHYQMATNRYIVLYVHQSYCEKRYASHERYSKTLLEMWHAERQYEIGSELCVQAIRQATKSWHWITEDIYDEDERPECEGTGEVLWEYKQHDKEDDCPICKGDGYTRRKKIAEKRIPVNNSAVYLNGIPYGPAVILPMLKVCNDLEVESIVHVAYSRNRNSLFHLASGIELVAKPLEHNPDFKESRPIVTHAPPF